MNRYRWLIGAAAVVAFGVLIAQAQQITQNAVSGNECWNAGQGPGGPTTGFICINLVRNGAALTPVSGIAGTPVNVMTQSNSTMYWFGAAPTTWTVNLPNPAFDGEIATIGTDTTLTSMVTVTPVAGSGQGMNTTFSAQTISAKTSVEFQFSASANKWFELR